MVRELNKYTIISCLFIYLNLIILHNITLTIKIFTFYSETISIGKECIAIDHHKLHGSLERLTGTSGPTVGEVLLLLRPGLCSTICQVYVVTPVDEHVIGGVAGGSHIPGKRGGVIHLVGRRDVVVGAGRPRVTRYKASAPTGGYCRGGDGHGRLRQVLSGASAHRAVAHAGVDAAQTQAKQFDQDLSSKNTTAIKH